MCHPEVQLAGCSNPRTIKIGLILVCAYICSLPSKNLLTQTLYVHRHTHAHMHMHTIRMYVFAHTHTHTQMHAHAHTHAHIHTLSLSDTHLCTRTSVSTHTHTHTPSQIKNNSNFKQSFTHFHWERWDKQMSKWKSKQTAVIFTYEIRINLSFHFSRSDNGEFACNVDWERCWLADSPVQPDLSQLPLGCPKAWWRTACGKRKDPGEREREREKCIFFKYYRDVCSRN